jgi:hypothetical protein
MLSSTVLGGQYCSKFCHVVIVKLWIIFCIILLEGPDGYINTFCTKVVR